MNQSNDYIVQNLINIKQEIGQLELEHHRAQGSVRLLAVSKNFPSADVLAAFHAGQLMFGENRVQELSEKKSLLPDSIEWHLIGQLQSNKVKKAVECASWIHSVDSLDLLKRIANTAEIQQRDINILLEWNSGEDSKSGFREHEKLFEAVQYSLTLKGVSLKGLMTMAKFQSNDKELHQTFSHLRILRDRIQDEFQIVLPELSMGMSNDFPQAIAEGATMVRIGTAIFGKRY